MTRTPVSRWPSVRFYEYDGAADPCRLGSWLQKLVFKLAVARTIADFEVFRKVVGTVPQLALQLTDQLALTCFKKPLAAQLAV